MKTKVATIVGSGLPLAGVHECKTNAAQIHNHNSVQLLQSI